MILGLPESLWAVERFSIQSVPLLSTAWIFLSVNQMATSRYLTKSRFKLAVECPRKLYYTGKKQYLDKSRDDSFLAALAEGGYQVGELAKLMYPGGVTIDELAHQVALDRTRELLQRDHVIIFEAALAFGNFFIRVDVLKKSGNTIELIEVKAKSYRESDDQDGVGVGVGVAPIHRTL